MSEIDNLEERLAQLGAAWPVGSMVNDVMARIEPRALAPVRRRRRVFAGVAASGLLVAACTLAWLIFFHKPPSLLAAMQKDLANVSSVHVVLKTWDEDGVAQQPTEMWYRRGEGLRTESAETIEIDDGKTQWSWSKAAGEHPVVNRRWSSGNFDKQFPMVLSLSGLSDLSDDSSEDVAMVRAPELDRPVHGKACLGYMLTRNERKVEPPAGQKMEPEYRWQVLAEPGGRIHQMTVQLRPQDGDWRRFAEADIDQETPVPPEKVAVVLPEGARIVDPPVFDKFIETYRVERALDIYKRGDLIFTVHDLQPLQEIEGFYVVTSVRPTMELSQELNKQQKDHSPELKRSYDFCFQPPANMMQGAKYDRVVLGSLARDGVEFSWWLIFPRRHFRIIDGQRVYEPRNDLSFLPGEPGRLDDLPGKVRLPLMATYKDKMHRDDRGVQRQELAWVKLDLPADRPPTTLEEVAARAKRDVALMNVNCAGGLLGVAPNIPAQPKVQRPLSRISPEVSDAEFAAAVQRGIDDLREFDEVRDLGPEDMLPPLRQER